MREMMKRIGVLLAAAVVVLAPAQVANAAGGTATPAAFAQQARSAGLDAKQAQQLQVEVDRVLAGMAAGGHQISANQVASDDGRLTVTVPVPGEATTRDLADDQILATCSYYYVCLFDEPNFSGLLVSLSACSLYDLGGYGLNDRLESYYNNQTSGTTARFYNWEGSWVYKFGSTAPHSDYDLNRWSGLANMIDAVDPC